MKLLKNTGINKYVIKLVEGKQLPYGLIYSLNLIELEILKIYIEIYLKTGFIYFFKSLTGDAILFNKKLDNIFYFYVN